MLREGEVRYTSGTLPTKYTYTGQYSNVSDFGLMYYNARWVDPVLGRFVQPDTIVPLASQGVQAWDRYAYVNNSPIVNTDPSGHCIWDGCLAEAMIVFGVVGGVIGYGAQVYNNYQNGYSGSEAWTENINVESIITAALTAPLIVLAAPEALSVAGYGMTSAGTTLGVERLATSGARTYATSLAVEEFLYGSTTSSAGIIVPNPNGMNGNSDHRAGVEYVKKLAQQNYPEGQGFHYQYNRSIQNQLNGIDRRPDLTVWDKNSNLVQVYEVARQNLNGTLVAREAAKQIQYNNYGINSFFYQIPK